MIHKKKAILYLLFIFSICQTIGGEALRINEIMYNPAGLDKDQEFIELYHEGWINLSGYLVSDGQKNESLIMVQSNMSSNFSLIIESDSILALPNVTIYITDTTIGNDGINNNETITIYDNNNQTRDSVKANSSIANNNGFSMEYFDGTFLESLIINGTPGYENSWVWFTINDTLNNDSLDNDSIDDEITARYYIDNLAYTNRAYENLFMISKKDCTRKNITYNYNITLVNPGFLQTTNNTDNGTYENQSTNNSYFFEQIVIKEIGCSSYSKTGYFLTNISGTYQICTDLIKDCTNVTVIDSDDIASDECNVSISIDAIDVYEDRIYFNNSISDEHYDYSIEYWIEDIFGNIVRQKSNTSNSNQKTYTPNIDERDSAYVIKNRLSSIMCNNTSPTTGSSRLVAVKGQIREQDLQIKSYDKTVTVGETMFVRIYIVKGNSTKDLVKAYVKDGHDYVSEISYINIYEGSPEMDIKMPIKIKDDCSLESKEYDLIVDGLDQQVTEKVTITGNCDGSSSPKISSQDAAIAPSDQGIKYVITKPENITDATVTNVEIINEDKAHSFNLIGYYYRGSKKYSDIANMTIMMSPLEKKSVELKNTLAPELDGEFKLKVRIYKDNLKTPKEFTYNFSINSSDELKNEKENTNVVVENSTGSKNISKASSDKKNPNKNNTVMNISIDNVREVNMTMDFNENGTLARQTNESLAQVTGSYLSSNKKAQKIVPYLMIGVFSLVTLVVVFKPHKV